MVNVSELGASSAAGVHPAMAPNPMDESCGERNSHNFVTEAGALRLAPNVLESICFTSL